MMEHLNVSDLSRADLITIFLCNISDDDFYYVLAYQIVLDGGISEKFLSSLDGKRLRGAIFGLGAADIDRSACIIEKYISNDDPLVAAEAIDALMNSDLFDWEHLKDKLLHRSPYVRGAALRFAKQKMGSEAKSLLIKYLNDLDPIVRCNSLDELEDLIEESDLSMIFPFMDDKYLIVRQAAQSIIDNFKSR